jgi:hypothetical protein
MTWRAISGRSCLPSGLQVEVLSDIAIHAGGAALLHAEQQGPPHHSIALNASDRMFSERATFCMLCLCQHFDLLVSFCRLFSV